VILLRLNAKYTGIRFVYGKVRGMNHTKAGKTLTPNKKLSYRRVTARCVLSVVGLILPITTQQYRNYLYDKSWPHRWYEVGGLVGGNVSYTNRRRSSRVYHLSTDDLLWRNFLSPQCRKCSRDPDHAHLGNTHSSQDKDFAWPTRVQNLKSLALAVAEILLGVVKF